MSMLLVSVTRRSLWAFGSIIYSCFFMSLEVLCCSAHIWSSSHLLQSLLKTLQWTQTCILFLLQQFTETWYSIRTLLSEGDYLKQCFPGFLDHSQEVLKPVHGLQQSPQQGPRSVRLLPATWEGETPPRSLGRSCDPTAPTKMILSVDRYWIIVFKEETKMSGAFLMAKSEWQCWCHSWCLFLCRALFLSCGLHLMSLSKPHHLLGPISKCCHIKASVNDVWVTRLSP